jgi:hypothetical protein
MIYLEQETVAHYQQNWSGIFLKFLEIRKGSNAKLCTFRKTEYTSFMKKCANSLNSIVCENAALHPIAKKNPSFLTVRIQIFQDKTLRIWASSIRA